MNRETLHRLHYLLANALYYSMNDEKLPDHMKNVVEALEIIAAAINKEE